MKRSTFTEEQIIAILREREAGLSTAEVSRKRGISTAKFSRAEKRREFSRTGS